MLPSTGSSCHPVHTLWPLLPIDGLPQVGMRLAPRPSLDGHTGLAAPHGILVGGGCLRRLVPLQAVVAVNSVIEPAHSKSMR
jgi:hypothetical protein